MALKLNIKMKLSIVLLTYNHEKYIAQALDGILMQVVNFDYELIILEDCSTDKTRDIVLQYRDKFKNIRIFFNKKNHGGHFTVTAGERYASGDYLCSFEGDDYWSDKNKLQQQVDFLDNHPDFIGCAHNTELFYVNENRRQNMLGGAKINSENTIINLIDGSAYFHTSSYVWRNIFKNGRPKQHCYNNLCCDWFLSMLYARHGKIKYFDSVMSVYRINDKGVWSKMSKLEQMFNNIRGMFIYNKLLNYEYDDKFKRIWWACDDLMKIIVNDGGGNKIMYLKLFLLKSSVNIKTSKGFDGLINVALCGVSRFLFNCFYLFDCNRYWVY